MKTTTTETISLSDKVEEKVLSKNQTFGIFPQAVSCFEIPKHERLKQDILKWMSNHDIQTEHNRRMISHNVVTIGQDNQLLNDLPHLKDALTKLVQQHNDSAFSYQSRLDLSESYLELANEGAIYAPHEHANSVYSGIYFVNYQPNAHSPIKFRRHIQSTFYPTLAAPCSKESIFNQPECYVPHNEGTVVIFPSNLTNGYESNSSGERITLSFNVAPI